MIALLLAAALSFGNLYNGLVMEVVDGDTIKVHVAVWPQIYTETSIRIARIDTPELRGQCEKEILLAIAARDFLAKLLPPGAPVLLANVKPDKYGGRHDADVLIGKEQSVALILIAEGHARPYDGKGARSGWCDHP
jgi:micrococcal nuclease